MTLFELVTTMAIGLSLLGLVGAIATRGQNSQRVSLAAQQIQMIVLAATTLYPPAKANNYSGLSNAQVAPMLPPNMVSQTGGVTRLINPWGGSYGVGPGDFAAAGDQTMILIQADNVPPSECLTLARNTGDSFDAVWINGTFVKPQLSPASWQTPAQIQAACSLAKSPLMIWEKL